MNWLKYIGLTACLLTLPCTAQISFFKAYSDQGYEVGEGIVQLTDSSYLLTGTTSSVTANSQAFICQVDSMGNRLWTQTYGGNESERGRRIFHVANDGIYVAGQSNSGTTFHDAYFFKTDLSGNLIYEKRYGTPAYDNILDGVMLPDTSFLLVGETYDTPNERENIWLLRIDKAGDTLWTKNIGSDGKDVARAVAMLNDSIVYVAGEYFVADSLMGKAMLMRLHINGTVEWMNTYGLDGQYAFNAVHVQDGIVRALGNHVYNTENGYRHQYLFSCDTDGVPDVQYDDIHDGDFSFEHLTQYGPDPEDFYFCSKVSDSPQINTYANGADVIIYKFRGGMYYNGLNFIPSNTGNDIINEAIRTSDGGAMMIGWNERPVNGGSNLVLIKIGPMDQFAFSHTIPQVQSLVSVQEIENEDAFAYYPNPVNADLFIEGIDKEIIRVFDQLGQLVLKEQLIQGKLDVSMLSPGLYFLAVGESAKMKFLKN